MSFNLLLSFLNALFRNTIANFQFPFRVLHLRLQVSQEHIMFDIASLVEYSELFADTLSNASYILFELFQFLASEWIEFEVDVGWDVEKFITVLN